MKIEQDLNNRCISLEMKDF